MSYFGTVNSADIAYGTSAYQPLGGSASVDYCAAPYYQSDLQRYLLDNYRSQRAAVRREHSLTYWLVIRQRMFSNISRLR